MKFWLCLLSLLPMLAQALPSDERFLNAREAFRTGDRARLATLYAQSAPAHDLDPWVEYFYLRQRISEDNATEVERFIGQQAGSYLGERLLGDRLKYLADEGRWDEYLAGYARLSQPQQDAELECRYLEARWRKAGLQTDAAVFAAVQQLWFATLDLPDKCQPLMEGLASQAVLGVDEVWTRMRLQLENKRYTTAARLADYLPQAQRPTLKQLQQIADKPQAYLKRVAGNLAGQRLAHELFLFAIQRQARIDTQPAALALQQAQRRLNAEERAYAWGQLAWWAAIRHQPEALEWYLLATQDVDALNDEQRAWRVRAALREHDWAQVRRSIEKMPDTQATQPAWAYWYGRALEEQGRRAAAQGYYRSIAGQPNFYGSLAAEELGQRITPPPQAQALSQDELTAAHNTPGLRRALALFRLNLRLEGIREWNWTLRGMADRQLLAAADLAQRSELFDRAIYAAERTQGQHDFSLRYLAPFRDQVEPRARQVALDSAWVYGLMRQESRFVLRANSSVGAKGLMQLMPKTAAWVAKKMGMKEFHPDHVMSMDTNVALGTYYLHMVLADLDDQPVLASAAYNAGPGRARRWRADRPLEGAIYAETIPFDETRDYVQKVMSNAVYYAALFEKKPQSLKARLGTIASRNASGSSIAGLP